MESEIPIEGGTESGAEWGWRVRQRGDGEWRLESEEDQRGRGEWGKRGGGGGGE